MDELAKIEMHVSFPASPDVVPVYANHLSVQFLGSEFVVSFYAAFPPMLKPEEARDTKVVSVEAKCVAKLVIGKDRMLDMVRALSEHVSRTGAFGGIGTDQPPKGDTNG